MNAPTTLAAPGLVVPAAPVDLSSRWARSASRLVVAGSAAIGLAVLAMAAWMMFAPLSGSIVSVGIVKVDTNRKTVQHRDGGIVRDILVREGDRVTAGQPLIVLDDTRVDASLDLTSSQLDAHRIRAARLNAERDLAAAWKLPDALRPRAKDPRVAELLAREQALFASRRGALDSQTRLVRDQIAEVSREVASRERGAESVRQAIASMQEEVRVNEQLMDQQFVNKTRVMGLKRAVSEYEIKLNDNDAELSKARQRISDLQIRLASLRDGYVQEASTELRDLNGKMIEAEEQLRSARDMSQRKVIAAPVAGRVVDLRVTTAGGTVGPRDPLLDIVPDGSPLLVEAKVPVDAIGELHVGLPTDVRLTTYKQRSSKLIDGKIVYVSADSLVDRQTGAPYYVVHVELSPESLAASGHPTVQPGMGAEIYVRTRERTPLDYLLEPLLNASRRSFREY